MENYNRIIKTDYAICYYLNGKCHRLDGPAFEYLNGDKEWFQDGKRHRIDGPAVEGYNGYKAWYQNGLLHRIDGPAVEFTDGIKHWYYEEKYITDKSQEEFEKIIRLKLFW
jgi:hypothetical protein